MPPSTTPSDLPSYLLTLAPLALSRTQRLVSTWLPPPTSTELQPPNTSQTTKADNWFAQNNELAGLGTKPTTTTSEDGDTESQTIGNSDERLRRLLLGKNWQNKRKEENNHIPVSRNLEVMPRGGSNPRPSASQRIVADGDESEEEGGRSSLGKRKGGKKGGQVERAEVFQEEIHDEDEVGFQARFSETSMPPKRGRSYLDEVLAENAAKKERKRKKRKERGSNG